MDLKNCDETKTMPVSWIDICYSNKNIQKYSKIMEEVCAENEVPFLDIDLLDDDDFDDGLHPNAQGHEKIFLQVKMLLKGAKRSEIEKATGWVDHSVRGFICSAPKRFGIVIESVKAKGEAEPVYTIVDGDVEIVPAGSKSVKSAEPKKKKAASAKKKKYLATSRGCLGACGPL